MLRQCLKVLSPLIVVLFVAALAHGLPTPDVGVSKVSGLSAYGNGGRPSGVVASRNNVELTVLKPGVQTQQPIRVAQLTAVPLVAQSHQTGTTLTDQIVYPDDVVRDSYGNPVAPFGALPDAATQRPLGIGHMTDVVGVTTRVSGDRNFPSATKVTENGFVVPSYASGLSQVNRPQDALQPPATVQPQKPTTLFAGINQFANDNSAQNEVAGTLGGEIFSGPAAGFIAPDIVYYQLTNSRISSNKNQLQPQVQPQRPPFQQQQQQQSPIQPQRPIQPIQQVQPIQPIQPIQPQRPIVAPVSAVPSIRPPAQVIVQQPLPPLVPFQQQQQQPRPIQTIQTTTPGRYTGGFGGAPGVLGEQKITTASPLAPARPTLPPLSISNPFKPLTPIQAPVQFQQPTIIAKPPLSLPLPLSPSTPNSDRYTGGFGGPPGVLNPYDQQSVSPQQQQQQQQQQPQQLQLQQQNAGASKIEIIPAVQIYEDSVSTHFALQTPHQPHQQRFPAKFLNNQNVPTESVHNHNHNHNHNSNHNSNHRDRSHNLDNVSSGLRFVQQQPLEQVGRSILGAHLPNGSNSGSSSSSISVGFVYY